jgi:hypothetical protein
MLNPERASENSTFSMQSTPAAPVAEVLTATEEVSEDVWAEWPYCWAIDLYEIACERFHSLHQNLSDWKLARINRRTQVEFQNQFWSQWQRDGEDETLELRLV